MTEIWNLEQLNDRWNLCILITRGEKNINKWAGSLETAKSPQKWALVSFIHTGQRIYFKPHHYAFHDGDLGKRSDTCDTNLGSFWSVCWHSPHSDPEMSFCLLQWPLRTGDRIHRNQIYEVVEITYGEFNKRTISSPDWFKEAILNCAKSNIHSL